MTRPVLLVLGMLVLAVLWLGPLPALAPRQFSAHMTLHMGVVAVAAPLLAVGIAGGRFDPTRRGRAAVFSAVPASLVELVVVWAWHAPALHHAARTTAALFAEQASFLAAAFVVWIAAFGGGPDRTTDRAAAGVVALLLTSMHMTLLGALLALAPRPLYQHAGTAVAAAAALEDQHLGGAIMLIAGGATYLAGGLWLASTLLGSRLSRREPV